MAGLAEKINNTKEKLYLTLDVSKSLINKDVQHYSAELDNLIYKYQLEVAKNKITKINKTAKRIFLPKICFYGSVLLL